MLEGASSGASHRGEGQGEAISATASEDERGHFAPEVDGFGSGVGASAGRRRSLGRKWRRGLLWLSEQRPAFASALEVEWARGIGFLCLPLLIGAGAVLYFLWPREPQIWTLLVSLGLAAAIAWIWRGRLAVHVVACAVLALLCGALAAKIETEWRDTPIIGSPIATEVTGRVVLVEHQANGRTRLTLDVMSTARPELRYAPDRIRVTARAAPDELRPGETVKGVVRLIPPSGPVRPGSYDFAFQSYFNGLGAIGFFLRNPERVERTDPMSVQEMAAARIETLRMAIAERIRAVIPGAAGEIAAALIAGVRAGIPDEVNEALQVTGLAHVLSISGLHMALAAATIMGTMRALFALFPAFSARRPVKKYAAATALAGTFFYLLLAGDQVAANRSFLMIAVMLAAILFDRAALSMRNLAIAALIILVVTPHEVMGPSFQMSFAATAALIAGYAGWAQWRQRRPTRVPVQRGWIGTLWHWLLVAMIGSIVTSILAGGATTIFSAYHFQRISPLTLLANLLTTPIIGILVMPPAVLAMVAMPFGLEALPLKVMELGLTMMLAVADAIAGISPPDAVGIVPAATVVLSTMALAVACFTTTRWRLLALPFAAAAMVVFAMRTTPDIYVSEDATLIGVAHESGQLLVNRDRPNAFTIDDWQRSASADEIVRPRRDGPDATGFLCTELGCRLDLPVSGIVWLPEGTTVAPHCNQAALIVIDDATNAESCPAATVLTKRDLGQNGSATLMLDRMSGTVAETSFAISQPYRPWHDHRRFSREARGMPPYRRPAAEPAAEPAAPGSPDSEPTNISGSGRPGVPEP